MPSATRNLSRWPAALVVFREDASGSKSPSDFCSLYRKYHEAEVSKSGQSLKKLWTVSGGAKEFELAMCMDAKAGTLLESVFRPLCV